MSLSSLHEQLRALRLGHFCQALQQQQEQPDTYTDMSFEERLGLLATHEILCRDNTKVKRLTRQAKLRFDARASGIDYRSGRGLKKENVVA
jgi:DNA replication protein DnaC